MTAFRWLVVALVAAGFTRPAAGASEARLLGHGTALVVEATVNGRFSGRFLVDTGATYCVVSRDVARNAKISGRVGGERIQLLTANGALDASLGQARKIEVGGSVARDVEVAVTREDPVPGLDGVLGLSFLNRFTYSVDAEQGVLRLDR